MTTISTLYELESVPVSDYVEVPRWVERDITCGTLAAILEGGCVSGAYMPAVTYSTALETMNDYGDEVLDYIESTFGEMPAPSDSVSWSSLAVHYLSCAVEMWAEEVGDDIAAQIEDSKAE